MEALAGQSLFDIALQYGGSMEAAFDIALQNNLSLTGTFGTDTTLRGIQPADQKVAQSYAVNGISPATGLSAAEQEELAGNGIGSWAIEYGFVVS